MGTMTSSVKGTKASGLVISVVIIGVLLSLNQYLVLFWLGCGGPIFAVNYSNETPLRATASALAYNVGALANAPFAFPPCDLSGLRVLLIWVHFEGNVGDEMETTPLLQFLRHCNAHVSAQLSDWQEEMIHPRTARAVSLVDTILLPADALTNTSHYDVTISSPGPHASFATDIVFGTSIIHLNIGDINPDIKLAVLREPLSYRMLLESEKLPSSARTFMSADLSFSFPASKAGMDYWRRYYLNRGFADKILVFSRANNFGPGLGVDVVADDSGEMRFRLKIAEGNIKSLRLDEVVVASSSSIEDTQHFQNLKQLVAKNYTHRKDNVTSSVLLLAMCEQVEQLWALVSLSRMVYTDRYHPGVAARIFDIPMQTVAFSKQSVKLDGLMMLSNWSTVEMRNSNREAFGLLEGVLRDIHTAKKGIT